MLTESSRIFVAVDAFQYLQGHQKTFGLAECGHDRIGDLHEVLPFHFVAPNARLFAPVPKLDDELVEVQLAQVLQCITYEYLDRLGRHSSSVAATSRGKVVHFPDNESQWVGGTSRGKKERTSDWSSEWMRCFSANPKFRVAPRAPFVKVRMIVVLIRLHLTA